MTDTQPQNIVEAYSLAARETEQRPELRAQAFDAVVAFCEEGDACYWEDTIKRNTLLLWAYDNVAEAKMAEGKYDEALTIWQRVRFLPKSAEAKISLGQKMLDALDLSRLSIAEKAQAIAEVSVYLQEAYLEIGDEKNAFRMDRMQQIARYVISRQGF